MKSSQLTGVSGEVDVGPVQAAGDTEALLQGVGVAEPIVWHRCGGRTPVNISTFKKEKTPTRTHCSATVVLFRAGAQQGRRPEAAPVPGEETWAAGWECGEGRCRCLGPMEGRRQLDGAERVTQQSWKCEFTPRWNHSTVKPPTSISV